MARSLSVNSPPLCRNKGWVVLLSACLFLSLFSIYGSGHSGVAASMVGAADGAVRGEEGRQTARERTSLLPLLGIVAFVRLQRRGRRRSARTAHYLNLAISSHHWLPSRPPPAAIADRLALIRLLTMTVHAGFPAACRICYTAPSHLW